MEKGLAVVARGSTGGVGSLLSGLPAWALVLPSLPGVQLGPVSLLLPLKVARGPSSRLGRFPDSWDVVGFDPGEPSAAWQVVH